ncbi:TasA family protein [Sutcliffiella horikoshii]|uniref:TasA family protein n=1 Tax=Sutcliffiella horikoshii TaxID=79883 RepID=UPI003CF8B016
MSLKKKLGLGVASAALGLSLIGGGTYAYFSDTAIQENNFVAGTLDLSVNPEVTIGLDNIKPGDWMPRTFTLENEGSLDISKIYLNTSYDIVDAKGDNTEDFGKHIKVNFLYNEDKSLTGEFSPDRVIYETTLYDLKNMTPDAVSNNIFVPWLEERAGLVNGDSDKFYVQFKFVNDGDQNQFQGDSLKLNWTFEAHQTAGERK